MEYKDFYNNLKNIIVRINGNKHLLSTFKPQGNGILFKVTENNESVLFEMYYEFDAYTYNEILEDIMWNLNLNKIKKVFLGGTCANSKWRNELIPKLKIEYFNPVVKNWTPECMKEEIRQRETCDYVLYILTRAYSTYSIAEVVDDSNKRPDKTICCIFNEKLSNGTLALSKQELKHLDQVGEMVKRNGGKYFKSLEEVAEYLNN